MNGWENQEAGYWGESQVKAALSESRITSASLDPDLGEDFLVEIGGHEASATGQHPKAALVQVKAFVRDCTEDEIKVQRIKKAKLMRWSSQQLPVFIIAVSGFSTGTAKFYIRAVDDYLEQKFAGIEIRNLKSATVTVPAFHVENIGDAVINGVENFYRCLDSDLSRLSASDKRNDHFEVASKGRPTNDGVKLKHLSWKVIWTASRRPAYFAGMLTALFHDAHEAYANLNVPAYVSFHIYRSQYDMKHNMAVARVHWVDEFHSGYAAAPKIAGRDNPTVNYVETDDGLRAFVDSKSTDIEGFVAKIKSLAPEIDFFARRLLKAEEDGVGGKEFWTEKAIAEYRRLYQLWEKVPLAPAELDVLEGLLDGYVASLTSHLVFSGRASWNKNGEHLRYRLETAQEIRYYFGSWWVLLKNRGWAFPYYS